MYECCWIYKEYYNQIECISIRIFICNFLNNLMVIKIGFPISYEVNWYCNGNRFAQLDKTVIIDNILILKIIIHGIITYLYLQAKSGYFIWFPNKSGLQNYWYHRFRKSMMKHGARENMWHITWQNIYEMAFQVFLIIIIHSHSTSNFEV